LVLQSIEDQHCSNCDQPEQRECIHGIGAITLVHGKGSEREASPVTWGS
jgi:hypothetical protein